MTYHQAIQTIMPYVIDGDTGSPFVISKPNEFWTVAFPNPAETAQDVLLETRKTDPLAVSFTGADFAGGSFPYVFDKVLTARLGAELIAMDANSQKYAEYAALLNLLEENIQDLSPQATKHIARYDRPLFQLEQMIPFSLLTDNSRYGYDDALADEAIEAIESKIQSMITRPIDEPQKRNIHGYEEKICMHLARKYLVIAENPFAECPYLVCNIKNDNPLNIEEIYNAIATDSYTAAMREFVTRLDGMVSELEAERAASGLEVNKLTAAECLPNSTDMDYEKKLVILKADNLAPEFRSAEHQLVFCTGGFGTNPKSRGRAVYAEELFSGKKYRYNREQIEGIADPEKLPQWARVQMAVLQADKETPETTKTEVKPAAQKQATSRKPAKKPTFKEKLDNAKQKAAAQESDKGTPVQTKKRTKNERD